MRWTGKFSSPLSTNLVAVRLEWNLWLPPCRKTRAHSKTFMSPTSFKLATLKEPGAAGKSPKRRWSISSGQQPSCTNNLDPHECDRCPTAPETRKFLKVLGSPCIFSGASSIISPSLTPVLPLDARPTHEARVEGVRACP